MKIERKLTTNCQLEMLKQQRNVLVQVVDSEFTSRGHFSDGYADIMLRNAFIVEDDDKWHSEITSMQQLIKHLYNNQTKTDIKLYEQKFGTVFKSSK